MFIIKPCRFLWIFTTNLNWWLPEFWTIKGLVFSISTKNTQLEVVPVEAKKMLQQDVNLKATPQGNKGLPPTQDASHKLRFRSGFPTHNPGGDWNPGWGGSSKVYRIYMMTTVEITLIVFPCCDYPTRMCKQTCIPTTTSSITQWFPSWARK